MLVYLIISFIVFLIFWYAVKLYSCFKAVEKLDHLSNFHCTSKKNNYIHWLKGHQVQFPPNNIGLLRSAHTKPLDFPYAFNYHVAPGFSMFQLYHPSTVVYFVNSSAPKDPISYGLLEPWLGKGLLTSNGNYWFKHRRMITPAFHFKVLKSYVMIFNSSVETFLNKLECCGEEPVEVFEHIRLLTIDTMLQCAMSSKTNCQESRNQNSYVTSIRKLLSITLKRLLHPLLIFNFFFWLSPYGKEYKQTLNIVHGHTENIIKQRKKKLLLEPIATKIEDVDDDGDGLNVKKRLLDFIDILLHSKDIDGKSLSDQEIREEVDTFLFEGHDTTSSGISWALYNLAKNSKYQDKCRKELNEVVGTKHDISWNDLSKLEYLGMCIKESLRLHPPVLDIGRKTEVPIEMNTDHIKGVIPAGTTIVLSIFQLHRNPLVWSEPNTFNPENFTKEKIAKRSPFAYLPFSAGSRNCIGQNFAMNEMKIVVGQILRKFELICDEDCPEPRMKPNLILESENGIHIKFKPVHI